MSSATKAPRAHPEYVLGTDATESIRLGLQHRLWSSAAHLLWEHAGVQPGKVVLDLGCGPGHAALDLAQIVGPKGRIIGVDESPGFLKQLHELTKARQISNVDRVLGDVQQIDSVLQHERGSVDFAYARWVFCFLKDPEAVVSGLAKIIKPGGKVMVQDYFNYVRAMTLAPRNPAFEVVIQAVGESWKDRGGDSDIMGRLPTLFLSHGFTIEHLAVHQRIARPGTTLWHWPQSFWDSFVPRLCDMGFISLEQRKAFEAAWSQASNDPGAYIVLPPVFDLVVVKS